MRGNYATLALQTQILTSQWQAVHAVPSPFVDTSKRFRVLEGPCDIAYMNAVHCD